MTTYFNYPPKEIQEELARIAKQIVAPGKYFGRRRVHGHLWQAFR